MDDDCVACFDFCAVMYMYPAVATQPVPTMAACNVVSSIRFEATNSGKDAYEWFATRERAHRGGCGGKEVDGDGEKREGGGVAQRSSESVKRLYRPALIRLETRSASGDVIRGDS